MKLVFVVDEGADAFCGPLNATAARDGVDLHFEPLLTPEQMFARIDEQLPDLVLLHHNWIGISISKILERLVAVCDSTRVVVFTGQKIKIAELIECVRSGVADYWERDAMTTDFIFRQISYYCSSSTWAIKILRTSSGSVAQLAERAEGESELRRNVELDRDSLKRKVLDLESRERSAATRDLRGLRRVLVIIGALLVTFVLANNYTGVGPWWSFVLVLLCGVVVLFFEGKISFAHFKWKGGSAIVKNVRDARKR